MKKRMKCLLKIIILFLFLIIFFLWQNNSIVTTGISYRNMTIPEEFNGFKIVHISDLHNKQFGREQLRLINKVKEQDPDIIVITGDLIDSRRYDLGIAMEFVSKVANVTPTYYASGNHEAASNNYEDIKKSLIEAGVEVLDNRKVDIIKNDSKIEILGLSDPLFYRENFFKGVENEGLKDNLRKLSDESSFQILLSHRPEMFDTYIHENIDLIFSGHAHGGQFRLPFIGGLFAPGQGFFPEYTNGMNHSINSSIVISRGLGNSSMPVRLFNRPEVVVVQLKNK